jgi:hypothetical protein
MNLRDIIPVNGTYLPAGAVCCLSGVEGNRVKGCCPSELKAEKLVNQDQTRSSASTWFDRLTNQAQQPCFDRLSNHASTGSATTFG